ncbi:TPA: type II secretion system protein GspD [Klebsiella quasipneumoniae subsp. quasipneumoniae]|nr:type II secretion system protein GspD [Klebsiella quasipneumoniae subsp. quasipneumoniae]
MKRLRKMLPALLILTPLLFSPAAAEEFSASFKGTDIQEFINTVSKNLNKTVIIDPSVRGTITVRSYDMLNEEQYYQFFLSVLDVYGFAVINMNNGVLKVVRAKDAKTSAVPVASEAAPGEGDEVVTRVVPLTNVAARDLAPLLRQLNDNAGAGSVVHYEPSNVLLMTGRAAVIKRLLTIVERVDNAGDRSVVTVPLSWASAAEVVKLVTELNKDTSKSALPGSMVANVVADERTNSVLVSGEPNSRQRIIAMIKQLDRQQAVQGNTKVIYLKYAKAADLVEVLTGISSSLASALGSFNGIAAGFYQGNWAMLLTALSSSTKNDILATPSIVTLDNMQATFNVGQEVPVLTGSQTTSGDNIFNTVERKTVGIKLKVKPQINEGDAVLLEIEQEVSSVADSASSTSSDLGATFNTRTVNNAVLVGSGETVVVGGLLDKSVTDSADKVPLLGDIPVIGALFRSDSKKVSKRNLMLFIRPTIIRDRDEYRRASSGQYTAFNDAQTKQRGKESSEASLSNDLLHIYPQQETQAFRQVSAAIDAFNLGGRP